MQQHIEPGTFRRFLRLELSPADCKEVVRHLLKRCPVCKPALRQIWTEEIAGRRTPVGYPRGIDHREVILRRAAMLEEERAAAVVLLHKIDRLSFAHQKMWLRTQSQFWTYGFAELLLERSWQSRLDCAEATSRYAKLAFVVVSRLRRFHMDLYGPVIFDLAGRAWGYIGNAETIRSNYAAARRLLQTSQKHLERGTGDPLEWALVLRFRASLESAQARYSEAKVLMRSVISIYRRAGDPHLVGVAMIDLGGLYGNTGELTAAIRTLRRSLDLVDPERDPKMCLAAHHNLAFFLTEAGLEGDAMDMVEENLRHFEKYGDRLALARVRWLQARIARSIGRKRRKHSLPAGRTFAMAEQYYLQAQEVFVVQGIGFDAAEVSMELATLYVEQGNREGDLQALAQDLVPIFQSKDMHHHAVAALRLFVDAADRRTVKTELLSELHQYLKQARRNPNLRFRALQD